ncbi:hypothetical protein FHR92_002927 [Fontibacillus solani]|uniref:Uncharacterized protein n=1 Tax=Fontibacillus solani TaxID=1572857 RepID=A0A7W3XSD5_9BACL|nr:hypothetical protein [Fontibacillus solani]MBA9086449.1 hypothetical protein [Fontibacillus solani]
MGTLRFSVGQWAFALSALWMMPGRGAGPAKADGQHQPSGAGFAVEWNGRKRGQLLLALLPVFGGVMAWQKSGLSRV